MWADGSEETGNFEMGVKNGIFQSLAPSGTELHILYENDEEVKSNDKEECDFENCPFCN